MKKKGFTLAEVLTTLGIIGVVAAITIPLLNSSTIGAKTGTKLAKSAAQIEQANMMIIQEAGTGSLTEAFTTNNGFFDYAAYKSALAKHLKFSDVAYFMNDKSLPTFGIQPAYAEVTRPCQGPDCNDQAVQLNPGDIFCTPIDFVSGNTCLYSCSATLHLRNSDGTDSYTTVDAGTKEATCPTCSFEMWYGCTNGQCYRKYEKRENYCIGGSRPADVIVDNSNCPDSCQSGNDDDDNDDNRITIGEADEYMSAIRDPQIRIGGGGGNNGNQSVEDVEINSLQALTEVNNTILNNEGAPLFNDPNHSFITKDRIAYALYVADSAGISTSLPPKSQRLGYVIVDIDGVDNGANRFAVDRFGFALFNDGSLRPIGADSWDGSANTMIKWQTSCPNGSIPASAQDRLTCTGSIYANKLKVEYRQK